MAHFSCFLTVYSCFQTTAAEWNECTLSFTFLILASKGQPAVASSSTPLAPPNTPTSVASQSSPPQVCPVHPVDLVKVLTLLAFETHAPRALTWRLVTRVDLVALTLPPGTYSAQPCPVMVPPEFMMVLG